MNSRDIRVNRQSFLFQEGGKIIPSQVLGFCLDLPSLPSAIDKLCGKEEKSWTWYKKEESSNLRLVVLLICISVV